jgi:hypothetical protein
LADKDNYMFWLSKVIANEQLCDISCIEVLDETKIQLKAINLQLCWKVLKVLITVIKNSVGIYRNGKLLGVSAELQFEAKHSKSNHKIR